MMYCEKCRIVFEGKKCPECGKSRNVREIRDDDLCLLTEKELIWSEMVSDALKDRDILFMKESVNGAGVSAIMGSVFENERFFVSWADYHDAKEIVDDLFSGKFVFDIDDPEEPTET